MILQSARHSGALRLYRISWKHQGRSAASLMKQTGQVHWQDAAVFISLSFMDEQIRSQWSAVSDRIAFDH
jgi:hypothetical protein